MPRIPLGLRSRGDDPHELPSLGIADRACQRAIGDHVYNVEVFDVAQDR
jgi:hypothetical protein